MTLTLSDIAHQPNLATYALTTHSGEVFVFRPLECDDVSELAHFLEGLSQETRRLSTFSNYDLTTAQELCDAINKYDKLRFILEIPSRRIIGLLEFSFDLQKDDLDRYSRYNISLSSKTDCRFGPTLADEYQNQGLGSLIFPYIIEVAKKFGRKRILLWGGVLKNNSRAIRFYEKNGFKTVGGFLNKEGEETVDMITNI